MRKMKLGIVVVIIIAIIIYIGMLLVFHELLSPRISYETRDCTSPGEVQHLYCKAFYMLLTTCRVFLQVAIVLDIC